MRKITVKSLLIICLAILPLTFFGQNKGGKQQKKQNDNHWFMDVDLGGTLLFGDNETFQFNRMRGDVRVGAGYAFAKYFAAYGKIGFGYLSGKKDNVFTTNLANYLSYDLNVSVDLMNLIFGFDEDRKFSVKPHVGIGQLQSTARATTVDGKMYKVGYLESEPGVTTAGKGFNGRKIYMEIPMGIEFEYNFNRKLAMYFDIQTTKVDSDRLEGIALGDHNDWFSMGNIGLRYNFRSAKSQKQQAAEAAALAKAAEEEAAKKAAEEAAQPKFDCESFKDCDAFKQAVKEAVEEALKEYQPAPAAQAVEAEEEEADETESVEVLQKNYEEKDIHLTFKVGKAEVEDNQANRNQVKEVNDEIEEGREIHTILTRGYASPEGNDKQNQKLSEDRAKATADYIQAKLGDNANGIKFDAKGMGSDWKGLENAIKNANIANKVEVEKAIANKDTAALNKLAANDAELSKILNSLRKTQVYINK